MTKYSFTEIKFNNTVFVFHYILECTVRKEKDYQVHNNELDIIGMGSTLDKAIDNFKQNFYELWVLCNYKKLAPFFQEKYERNLTNLIKSISYDK